MVTRCQEFDILHMIEQPDQDNYKLLVLPINTKMI